MLRKLLFLGSIVVFGLGGAPGIGSAAELESSNVANKVQLHDIRDQPAALQNAVFVTQMLALATCKDKAMIDPQVLLDSAPIVYFVLALYTLLGPVIATPNSGDDLKAGTATLSERLGKLRCDEQGIVQLPKNNAVSLAQ